MEKKIYVYENWSSDAPRKLGTLFVDSIRGSEHSSFQFDNVFLADACTSQMLMLDPDLSLVKTDLDEARLKICALRSEKAKSAQIQLYNNKKM